MPPVHTAKLRRFRTLPQDGGKTLYFKLDVGRLGRFLNPHEAPDFGLQDNRSRIVGVHT